MDMYIKIYYQDFSLNSTNFNENEMSLNETEAVCVAEMSLDTLRNKVEGVGMEIGSHPSMVDIADIIFQAFNLYPTEIANVKGAFKAVGHTSMSIGDYVVFRPIMRVGADEDVLICAPAGWKNLSCSFGDFIRERDMVIEKMYNMPIDILNAMHTAILSDNFRVSEFYRILEQFKNKRCENHCPKCYAEDKDIEWAMKDIQDNKIIQNACCKKCGCEFTEISGYEQTEIIEVENAKQTDY